MDAPGRRHFNTAVLGFAITALFVSYMLLTDSQSAIPRNPRFMLLFVILCPPSLFSIVMDPEVGTNGFFFLWTVIALLNGGLYATVRLLFSRRLHRPE